YVKNDFQLSISQSTISRILNEFGMHSYVLPRKPKLTSKQKKLRLSWCTKHLDWSEDDWKNIIFTDESRFQLINRKNRIYVRRHHRDPQRYNHTQVRVHTGCGVGVWSYLTSNGVGNLVFYNGSLDSYEYINILKQHLKTAYNNFATNGQTKNLLPYDNGRSHTSKLTQEYLNKQHINILDSSS
ncbi:unnamed protein product, partial [Rotaria sp. Silwood2]